MVVGGLGAEALVVGEQGVVLLGVEVQEAVELVVHLLEVECIWALKVLCLVWLWILLLGLPN